MAHETLTVELGERSYPIFIGSGLLGQPALVQPFVQSGQVLIVTNTTIAPLYLDQVHHWLQQSSSRPLQIESVSLADGEQHKHLASVEQIFDRLLELNFNRKVLVVALGGGVVGDMAGFAAACYQRGVAFLQIPTTLLSQVDSSVGGKTGVNHPRGKNMIGAFWQPEAVFIDTDVLKTLPPRELAAGLAEVIKYGLIADAEFFVWLENNIQRLIDKDPEALQYAIRRSCEIKAEVVAQDEKEAGLRAILNLGHTYGHAIETEMGYGQWLHGEAVAAGMVMACELSEQLGWLEPEVTERARQLILKARLPAAPPPQMHGEAFEKHMKVDKKVLDGRIRLVLLKGLGQATVTSDFDPRHFERQLAGLGQV